MVSAQSKACLKMSENVYWFDTLKKHSALMDMCKSTGSTSLRNTPALTPRSYTVVTELIAGAFNCWMCLDCAKNSPLCMFSFITNRMKSGLAN